MKWLEMPIKKLCLPTYQRDPREKPNEIFSYVDISSIDRERKVISQTSQILGAEAPSRARKEIKAGDILVSTVRPNLNAVAMVPPELDGQIASTGFCVLRPKSDSVLGGYLFYYTRTPDFFETLSSKVRGAHYPAVSDRDVKGLELPLPPLSEQRRIVEILDQADALRKKRAEADKKAERILTALFYKMFGDPIRNPKGWHSKQIGDLLSLIRNGTTAEQNTDGKGYPVTRIETISGGVIDQKRVRYVDLNEEEFERWRMLPGDILFSHINSESHIGKTALYEGVPDSLIHGMNLLLLRPNQREVLPQYLFALLNADSVRAAYRQRCKRAVNQASLNQRDISSLMVAVAPLELQRRFCDLAQKVLSQIGIQKHTTTMLDTLFDALLHRAFTGDLTAKWREAHMKELLAEMDEQAKALNNIGVDCVR